MLSHPAILERVLGPERGGLSPELARHVLTLDFPAEDHARYAELSSKASAGTINDDEKSELEDYLNVNDFLTIIKAKAQVSLHRNPAA